MTTLSPDLAILAHRDRCEQAGLCHICGAEWNRAKSPHCPSESDHPVSCCCDRPRAHRRVCADARDIKTPCRCACHRGVKKGLPRR